MYIISQVSLVHYKLIVVGDGFHGEIDLNIITCVVVEGGTPINNVLTLKSTFLTTTPLYIFENHRIVTRIKEIWTYTAALIVKDVFANY